MFEKELDAFGKQTNLDLIANYVRLGLRAFGEFERGLSYEATSNNLTISAPFHARIMEGGRSAGKFPPPDEILRWVRLGKIVKSSDITDEQLAYLIGRKIAREGIKVPNKYNIGSVISSVLADGRIDSLISDILAKTQTALSVEAIKMYKNV